MLAKDVQEVGVARWTVVTAVQAFREKESENQRGRDWIRDQLSFVRPGQWGQQERGW